MTKVNREKTAADPWPRLAEAALGARDDLRRLASELTEAMAAGSIPRALILRARDTAARHADGLRLALKRPTGSRARQKDCDSDLPCWSSRQ